MAVQYNTGNSKQVGVKHLRSLNGQDVCCNNTVCVFDFPCIVRKGPFSLVSLSAVLQELPVPNHQLSKAYSYLLKLLIKKTD